jgi:hypothetical protein
VGSGMFGSYAGGRSQSVLGDSAGRIYVADSYQGFVRVFDSQGAYLGKIGAFGAATGQLRSPAGLALDGFNRLQVASINNSRVEFFGLDAYFHLTATPAQQIFTTGADVVLSVVAGGGGSFTYQWRKGTNNLTDGGNVSGATNATLTLTGLAPADSGLYSVVVVGPTNTFTSPDALLQVVLRPPDIVIPPVDQTVAQGTNVSFEVVTSGDSPAYQWYFNEQEMAGATTSVLQITNAQPADSGTYSVVISNAVGVATGAAALSVLVPPAISGQPAGQTVIQWDTVTFGVAAEGDSLAYQWFFNSNAIPGATENTLVRAEVQQAEQGVYSVVVSNLVGVVTSDPAPLTVVIPPPPTHPPQINAVMLLPDDTLQLSVSGEAGHAFAIDASTNLADWAILARIVSRTGGFEFTDLDAPGYPQRFYRVVWTP